jgi:hypothetical protein
MVMREAQPRALIKEGQSGKPEAFRKEGGKAAPTLPLNENPTRRCMVMCGDSIPFSHKIADRIKQKHLEPKYPAVKLGIVLASFFLFQPVLPLTHL